MLTLLVMPELKNKSLEEKAAILWGCLFLDALLFLGVALPYLF